MTAKAQFDPYGDGKIRKFGWRRKVILPASATPTTELAAIRAEWKRLHKHIRRKLRPFYPYNDVEDPTFGHPADEWASSLLEVAESEASTWLWQGQRLTNEQLRAEQRLILKALERARQCLTEMSDDLHNVLDREADVSECRDRLSGLIPHVECLPEKINVLWRAKKDSEIKHKAALEMTVQVVRFLKSDGIKVTATADKDRDHISVAVKILKVLGDALQLEFDETTWRDLISEARPLIAGPQSSEAPAAGGA